MNVTELRQKYPKGTKIRINYIDDPYAHGYTGREGEVTNVDDMGQIHGTWGGLALIPGADSFTVIEERNGERVQLHPTIL